MAVLSMLYKCRGLLINTEIKKVVSVLSHRNYSSASAGQNEEYDIIIAGGGMVGTSFALALAKDARLADKRVLLLEGGGPIRENINDQYSNRVSALSRSSAQLLSSIGAWEQIVRKQPVNNMQIWDACSDALITFNENDFTDIAYIVENDAVLRAVYRCLDPYLSRNTSLMYDSRVKNVKLANHTAQTNYVELDNGSRFSCELLVGADGANSQVRREMGVQYVAWKYDQMGVVATVHLHESGSNNTAWQRFIPGGPVALLPLADGLSSLVWSTSPKRAKELLAMPDEEFVNVLNDALMQQYPHQNIVSTAMQTLDSVLGSILGITKPSLQFPPSIKSVQERSRASFPLGFGHSTNYVQKGVALIGDAAHRVHPLAGQGVNLGFGDVSELSALLADAIYRGESISNDSVLQQYQTARQRHVVPTMIAIEGLQQLYSTEILPVVLLRSMGLQFTNALSPVKKAIIGHATGAV